jgi:phosphoribosyl-dephospho-CoA transferase
VTAVTTDLPTGTDIDLVNALGDPIHRRELPSGEPKRRCWFCGRDAVEAFSREETGPYVPFCEECQEAFGNVKLPE